MATSTSALFLYSTGNFAPRCREVDLEAQENVVSR